MNYSKNTTIEAYLDQKGIEYQRIGKEILTACVFSDCDRDSRGSEAHLYFNAEGQYDCKKCGAKGNMTTLLKHFGDEFMKSIRNPEFDLELVEKCHREMPVRIRQYLKDTRGLTDEIIDTHKLGYGFFYSQWWITFPIKDGTGQYSFFKLRQDPANGSDKRTFPKSTEAHPVYSQIYDWETLNAGTGPIVVCEGELDRLLLLSKGVDVVTSTHGVKTFKEEWVSGFIPHECVYICFDHDEAGRTGALEAAQKLYKGGVRDIRIVTLPDEVGEKGDVTDYFTKHGGIIEDLLGKYAASYPERFDTSKFKPMTVKDVIDTLGLTIKRDEHNKVTALFCELAAYTEEAQFNISFSAPSSTGKSFIPMEVAKLFPQEDVIMLSYSSPTAFFHDSNNYNPELNQYTVDLERKILIFMDQPHYQLLEKLRPLLSHDKKEILMKITDKNAKGGLKTKNIVVRGYPSVVFCTADIELNDQEATRLLLLSPEISQEKIREGVLSTILKEADSAAYNSWLNQDPGRSLLKDRIRAIKAEGITDINITPEMVTRINAVFLDGVKLLKPRHQRDAKKLMSLVKSHALLNLWHRERDGSVILANIEDVEAAIKLWETISVSQELNLPPYLYDFYTNILVPLWRGKVESLEGQFADAEGRIGLTRSEILTKHRKVTGRLLDPEDLRLKMLPMLETAGLITQEMDPDKDKRQRFVYLVSPENILGAELTNNGAEDPGVNADFDPEKDREYE